MAFVRPTASGVDQQMQAVRRLALTVAKPCGPSLQAELVRELAAVLDAALVVVTALPPPGTGSGDGRWLTLAAAWNGRALPADIDPLRGAPWATATSPAFRYAASGVLAACGPDAWCAAEGLDACAGHVLIDSHGEPRGLIWAMDRHPIAGGDAEHARMLLQIAAARAATVIECAATGAVGHGRDVAERHRAEQGLRDSEAQYRDIFNASADALVLRAADFSIVDVNATYESMSGYTRDEVLGVDRVLANPIEVQQEIRALHERALAGETIALETQLVRRDGVRYDLELRGVPVLRLGRPHVLYIGRDITQRKRAESALRASEEQYRAMFHATADALILRDAEFRAVEVNPAYCAISGFTREEVLASTRVLMQEQPALQLRHRVDHERVLAGEALRFEATARRRDGRSIPIEVRGMPVSYRGQPHVLYALRDMTERNAAEQRRSELERQLRQAQKMEAIGQLTGGIAHDFNNILASVIGYVTLAQERAETIADATLMRQLGQARLAADRARELIAQMLAFARRQRGTRRALALLPLLQQTLTLLRATLPSTVTLEVDAPPDGDAPWVEADPVQLEQVLFNLCINARDAVSGQGRITVRLRRVEASGADPSADAADPAADRPQAPAAWHCASCRAAVNAGTWAELAVEDDGAGIESDLLERIFDPFFSTKAPGKGSGMGLAMVHGIVHDHGGHLRLATVPSRGSCFCVWLPLAARAEASPDDAVPIAGRPALLQGRVLLVEDDTMVGDYLAERLANWGLTVRLERAATAAAAWLDEPEHGVDLLVTDQTMPHMTGLQLAERVHAVRPTLPVVLVSGNADAFEPAELARCGVVAVLGKPIDAEQLRGVLRRLLGQGAPPPGQAAIGNSAAGVCGTA